MVASPVNQGLDGVDTTLQYLRNIEDIIFGNNGKNGMLTIEMTAAMNIADKLHDTKRESFTENLGDIMRSFNQVGDDIEKLRDLINFTLEASDGYSSGPGLIELERNYINCCNALRGSIDAAYKKASEIFREYGISNIHKRFKDARPTLDDSVDSLKELGISYIFGHNLPQDTEGREGSNQN
ncbi:hypothetical protein CMI45_01875 [Candidatus Pacearchaeota archaeon]|nr:hypothetical protein [Candidatus Pacearchaeota archaeon]|tara:strand:- start:1610 stop:2155 length:546 start_codon:yes stop_codon:yes gene_type:complete